MGVQVRTSRPASCQLSSARPGAGQPVGCLSALYTARLLCCTGSVSCWYALKTLENEAGGQPAARSAPQWSQWGSLSGDLSADLRCGPTWSALPWMPGWRSTKSSATPSQTSSLAITGELWCACFMCMMHALAECRPQAYGGAEAWLDGKLRHNPLRSRPN